MSLDSIIKNTYDKVLVSLTENLEKCQAFVRKINFKKPSTEEFLLNSCTQPVTAFAKVNKKDLKNFIKDEFLDGFVEFGDFLQERADNEEPELYDTLKQFVSYSIPTYSPYSDIEHRLANEISYDSNVTDSKLWDEFYNLRIEYFNSGLPVFNPVITDPNEDNEETSSASHVAAGTVTGSALLFSTMYAAGINPIVPLLGAIDSIKDCLTAEKKERLMKANCQPGLRK